MQTRFALIIGVSDYSAYDRSADNLPGTTDLFGPPANIHGAHELARSLGYSATDVGVLASPLVPPNNGRPALYSTATRASVLEGVRTLAARLAAGAQSQGLIWFSGHGTHIEGVGPALCLADTRVENGVLVDTVSLAEIAAILDENAPGRGVTFVLDACGSGVSGFPRFHTAPQLRACDTLLSSTGPQELGVEVNVDHVWRGAFSWALCAAASQFERRFGGGFLVPDLTNRTWIELARRLLRGLSVSQHPQLHGAPGAAVLQPTGVDPIHVTFHLAGGRRGFTEIYGDESGHITGNEPMWTVSDLRQPNGTSIGTLCSSYATPSNVLSPYKDLWKWNSGSWPDSFQVVWQSTGTAGTNNPPTGFTGSSPLSAFLKNLTQSNFSSTQVTPGDQVWSIVSGGLTVGYLVRYPGNGNLTWYITWTGYQNGEYLTNLPAPGGSTGGIMMKGSTMVFSRYYGSSLASVSPAYVVAS